MSKEGMAIAERVRRLYRTRTAIRIIRAVERLIVLTIVFASQVLTACTTDQLSRGIYEGSKAYDKSIKSTPLEKSKSELPSYDQYEKERRGGAAP